MKRKDNLYEQICSMENLLLADKKARKGKGMHKEIVAFDQERDANFLALQQMLINKTYRTSEYATFEIREPKVRLVYKLPYFPDRIAHHAIMNVLEPVFTAMFTADTYSCIKGRGTYGEMQAIRKALKDVPGTEYGCQLDIVKFYPNVDHSILKQLLRKKFKDQDLLWLLDEIIDSADGLPIGNYTSQFLANFYLTYFDHWIKEVKGVKYYFRYADDILILSHSKKDLHQLRAEITNYLRDNLKLTIKGNYQVFPVRARGVNKIGYIYKHSHTRVRKKIKQNFARMLARRYNTASVASYKGWIMHSDGAHLMKKLLPEAA